MRRLVGVWALCLTALLGGLATPGCSRREPLRFEVVFEDAGGLEEGMPVTHRGLEIGKVTAVGLDEAGLIQVSVEVKDRFRTAVSKDSVIRPESYGLRRHTRLTIEDPKPAADAPRIAVADGDVLVGTPGLVDDVLSTLQETARAAWEKTRETAAELGESLDQAAERGREDWKRLQREQVPALRQQAEAVRKQLEEAGLPEEAERFWREFEGWLDKLSPPAPEEPGTEEKDEG